MKKGVDGDVVEEVPELDFSGDRDIKNAGTDKYFLSNGEPGPDNHTEADDFPDSGFTILSLDELVENADELPEVETDLLPPEMLAPGAGDYLAAKMMTPVQNEGAFETVVEILKGPIVELYLSVDRSILFLEEEDGTVHEFSARSVFSRVKRDQKLKEKLAPFQGVEVRADIPGRCAVNSVIGSQTGMSMITPGGKGRRHVNPPRRR